MCVRASVYKWVLALDNTVSRRRPTNSANLISLPSCISCDLNRMKEKSWPLSKTDNYLQDKITYGKIFYIPLQYLDSTEVHLNGIGGLLLFCLLSNFVFCCCCFLICLRLMASIFLNISSFDSLQLLRCQHLWWMHVVGYWPRCRPLESFAKRGHQIDRSKSL